MYYRTFQGERVVFCFQVVPAVWARNYDQEQRSDPCIHSDCSAANGAQIIECYQLPINSEI